MKTNLSNTETARLRAEVEQLKQQLEEAHDVIEAIRTGQVDALVVQGTNGHQLYTLKTADQTYRMFIENMAEGAVTLNNNGDIVYSNSQFATMLGMQLSEVIGVGFEQFVEMGSRPRYRMVFEEAWNKDIKEEMLLKLDGNSVPVQLSLTKLQMEQELSLSIIITDLSLHKEHQEQLRRSNEQLEAINHALEASNHDLQQFASVASHDLQEPLRKIQLFADLLKEKYASELSENAKLPLQKIMDSSSRMKTLVEDILNYSKLSANNKINDTIDLNNLLNGLIEDFELAIEEKNATIFVEPLNPIQANMGQIRQVFQNLISNSLKFAKPSIPPAIKIWGRLIDERIVNGKTIQKGNFYEIHFSDNGIGFEEKYHNNIFSLFIRLHPKDKYEGSGIGLAIAKKIIEKHNGNISVIGREGQGAEFIIVLPVFQDETAWAAE